ncbi:hypothetical protein [Nocardia blacklockiae]|uniref:hypothetical protein n=1 Tax=Nocardia blacklockiae TaxID=480036 RepID=UPI001893374E|nr:hypothetical protein [Nocardia blacklockiae]MBF6171453.1 hypothetical protein [Nocardia blacklockiae]
MTGRKVRIDPTLQRRAAAKAQHVSDRIADALTTLEASADAKGSPWGNDRYGTQFADGEGNNGYNAARANLKKLTGSLGDHSGEHSSGQQRAATLHDNTDTGSAEQFR